LGIGKVRVLKESKYTYLEINKRRERNKCFVWTGISLVALIITILQKIWILLPLVILSISLITRYLNKYRSWSAGKVGEEVIPKVLQGLDDSYCLLNDVVLPGQKGNIDHVLLSPKSIFIIETKNYSGEVGCYGDEWYKRGRRKEYPIGSISKQAKRNALGLRNFIRKTAKIDVNYVTPICVFSNLSVKLNLHEQTVPVLRLEELIKFIKNAQPSISLPESQLQSIAQSILRFSP